MKNNIFKITALSLLAAAFVVAPATLRAQSTNAPAASGQETPAKPKKHEILPFHGKVTAVDKVAMTITVGARTFEVTSKTKITKDKEPATLGDAVVGEMIGGAYKKSADGKLTATSLRLDLKAPGTNKQ